MNTLSFTFTQQAVRSNISFVPSDSVNTGVCQQDTESGLLQLTTGDMVAIVLSHDQETPSIAPPDLSPEQVELFKAKGLTYRLSPEGYFICVWMDPETHKMIEFVYDSQTWINTHAPYGMIHKKNLVTSHRLRDGGVYHFTKKGANTYLKQTLARHNLTLGDQKITEKLTTIFGSDMHVAFGIPFTSWSYPGGDLCHDDIDNCTSLWLIDGCLHVGPDFSRVTESDFVGRYGYGLFLQVTSSGI